MRGVAEAARRSFGLSPLCQTDEPDQLVFSETGTAAGLEIQRATYRAGEITVEEIEEDRTRGEPAALAQPA
jgi:hypothetical protein